MRIFRFNYKWALLLSTLLTGKLLSISAVTIADDQDQTTDSDTSVALSQQVLNPTTMLWQMQLEEFFIGDTKNESGAAQNFRLRAIIPLEEGPVIPLPQLIRVIGFINTSPDGHTGLGDTTFNQFFILDKDDWGEFGAGWDVLIPTADDDRLGSKQWQVEPSATISFSDLGNWQLYWVWQNFFSTSGNDKYGNKAYAVLQPNLFYTWPSGVYMGMEPEWKADYKTGDVAIPLNFRVGYIYEKGGYKFNAYIEPEWMAYRSNKGATLNDTNWGIRFG